MDASSLYDERGLLVPNASRGRLGYQRHRIIDAKAGGAVREVDSWIGTREAWESSPLASAIGWSVGELPNGLVNAIRLV